VSKFLLYLFLVVKRTFWGADNISKTLGVISLFVVVGFQFTSLPWEARLGLLAALVFVGTFNVWNDEKKVAETAEKQLKEIKDKTPNFDVSVGEVKRYTIKPIVDKYAEEVREAQRVVDAKKSRENASHAGSTFGILGIAAQMSSALSSLPGMLRQETPEEKLECLSEYLGKLREYEIKLKQLYKIDLSLTASRSDANIEVWVGADNVSRMVVKDEYAKNSVPDMPRYRDYSGIYIPPSISNFSVQNKLYLASYGDKDGAYSKIANLNAQRPLLVFDEDFYILTDKKSVNLKITITSQKRNEQQETTVVVPLENVPVETFEEEVEN